MAKDLKEGLSLRNIVNFNAKWAFTKQADAIPSTLPMDWNWVNLPHTWNALDGNDGGNDYFRGNGYYAKALDKMDLPEADRYYLEIQGANSSADVYLNGKHLAHHDGGYSTWRVDITETLERENLFAIVVNNEANDTVYPQMADFTFYGGLYRDVNIICVNESHFDLDYYGSNGVKITPVENPQDVNPHREYRKVPMTRLKERLGLTNYDVDAPLVETKVNPDRVKIMLSQHIGAPAKLNVKSGDDVNVGDILGIAVDTSLGVSVHSSVDGKVLDANDNYVIVDVK